MSSTAQNLWLSPQPRPLVIGHRGASAHAAENTLTAFRLAMLQDADGIELDVKRCASGEVVVMHDATVDRTTDGAGQVHALSFDQLRALDASGGGEPPPTLDEVFELIKPHPTFLINIEITNYTTPRDGLEDAVIEIVRRHGIGHRVLYSSFNHLLVRKLAALDPDIPRALLYDRSMPLPLRNVWLSPLIRHEFRHPHHSAVTLDFVRKQRAAGRGVNVWTVNEVTDIRRMIAAGVTGIIGDSPVTIRQTLGLG
jgi:glycerophosphoryl diester phosphodiesterase